MKGNISNRIAQLEKDAPIEEPQHWTEEEAIENLNAFLKEAASTPYPETPEEELKYLLEDDYINKEESDTVYYHIVENLNAGLQHRIKELQNQLEIQSWQPKD